eukprot:Colp12_sorted_trinity150504_noHs@5927
MTNNVDERPESLEEEVFTEIDDFKSRNENGQTTTGNEWGVSWKSSSKTDSSGFIVESEEVGSTFAVEKSFEDLYATPKVVDEPKKEAIVEGQYGEATANEVLNAENINQKAETTEVKKDVSTAIPPSHFRNLLAGITAGFVAELILYPLEAGPKLWRPVAEGTKGLYDPTTKSIRFGPRWFDTRVFAQDIRVVAATKAPVAGFMMAFYEYFRAQVANSYIGKHTHPTVTPVIASLFANLADSAVMTPILNFRTRYHELRSQITPPADETPKQRWTRKFNMMGKVASEARMGTLKLTRGYWTPIVSNGPFIAVYYASCDVIAAKWAKSRNVSSPAALSYPESAAIGMFL